MFEEEDEQNQIDDKSLRVNYSSLPYPKDLKLYKYIIDPIYDSPDCIQNFKSNFKVLMDDLYEQKMYFFYENEKKQRFKKYTSKIVYSPRILDLNLQLVQSELNITIKQVSLLPAEQKISFKLMKYNHFITQELGDMSLYKSYLKIVDLNPLSNSFKLTVNQDYYGQLSADDQKLYRFFQKYYIMGGSDSHNMKFEHIREINLIFEIVDGKLHIKVKNRYKMIKYDLGAILNTLAQNGFQKNDLQQFTGNEVLYCSKIYKIVELDFHEVILQAGKFQHIETVRARPVDCLTKNNAEFFNMGEVDKVKYDDEFEGTCVKLIYNIIVQRIVDMFNTFNGTNEYVPSCRDSEYQKVQFTTCTNDSIRLNMRDHVITDEKNILKDTLDKKWYTFSNKKQCVKIYSKLNQFHLLNVARKCFDKIEHFEWPMEKIESINYVVENEIKNYNHNYDTYIIISVQKDMYKPDSMDKHYALITYFKYWLNLAGYNLFLMFMSEQHVFEKKYDLVNDIHYNIIRSIWLKNPLNRPYNIAISHFIKYDIKEWLQVFIGFDIAHKRYSDKGRLNSILSMAYTIGDRVYDVKYERIMFNQTQFENPKLYQYRHALEQILFKLRTELEILRNSNPKYANIKPWFNYIRDGINTTNIELLYNNEIIPMTQMFDDSFKEGYNFIYSNYIKEYDSSLVNNHGQSAKVTGYSVDERLNFEKNKQILYSIIVKPYHDNGKLMYYYYLKDKNHFLKDINNRMDYAKLLYNMNYMTFTHNGIVNNSVYIQQADKDGRKLMDIQKSLSYLNAKRLLNSDLSDILQISMIEKDYNRKINPSRGGARGGRGGARGSRGGARGGRGGVGTSN